MTTPSPAGFRSWTAHLGLADGMREDFAMVISETPCTSSVVFTKSLFAGACVSLGRESLQRSHPRGVAILAKNANVATGAEGMKNAQEIRAIVARAGGVDPDEVVMASTGVIGVQYPMPTIRRSLADLGASTALDPEAVATAIMTTDTRPKVSVRMVGNAKILGVAKGVGMIEPDMATMLSFVFTDAQIAQTDLDRVFRATVERTYNSVSIDTDTSTSDTAAVFANGEAGPVELDAFADALTAVCTDLVKMIASDGEGASKLITVSVTGASSDRQARTIGKAIVNSPLVKTMVHGEDPNWGRILMAIGKCSNEPDIEPESVRVSFGDTVVYPEPSDGGQGANVDTEAVRRHLARETVEINVDLGAGRSAWTVYGCDLTDGYIRINADYTT
ncbi:bifunctional glutamate N-acetyltransferase/amino-acid acetyltransferase ArgJ [Nocardia sp. NPDC058640]|uniref:bifunctional glutamate N-acetyltransferase/amino-acid acetyltransferase ArgJ n=1 Tax=Nocardia sp. NPDC058640 TaxID=3346571 RepID=UPI003665349C